MNLIEQLGGYECAAYEYKNTLLADDFPYVIKATGTKFTRPELGDELLEHRRQHNIFEVGDKVVFKDGSHALDRCDLGSGEVLVIKDIDFYDYLIFECSPHGHGQKWFRHATDAEIKAGKRLEVNQ